MKKKKPLTISIHGEGVDIDATFSNVDLAEAITKVLQSLQRTTTPPFVERPPVTEPKSTPRARQPRR